MQIFIFTEINEYHHLHLLCERCFHFGFWKNAVPSGFTLHVLSELLSLYIYIYVYTSLPYGFEGRMSNSCSMLIYLLVV